MNQFFDKVYLMNLKRRTDRLEQAQEELHKHGIVYTIVEAVDGEKLDLNSIREPLSDYDGPGVVAVGMTLSQIFTDAIDKGHDKILVLEDDVEFHNLHIFEDAVKNLPITFDLLYLGAQHKEEPEQYAKNLVRVNRSYLCHAVGFGRAAMEYLRWAVLEEPNEEVYTYIQYYRKNSFCISPNIAFQKQGKSDISGMVANYDEILEKQKSLSN